MNLSDTIRLIAKLKARYPNSNWSNDEQATIEAWHESLEDLPTPLVMQVLPAMMRESRVPPDPADIRSRLFDSTGLLPDPERSWKMVLDVVKGRAFYDDLPYVMKLSVKECGGLRVLRMSEKPERDKADFLRAYGTLRKQAMTDPEAVKMLDALAIGAG
jgi:hypothetical protein